MIAALFLFAAIGGLIAVDVVSDLTQGSSASHIVFEASAMAIALAGVAFLLLRLRAVPLLDMLDTAIRQQSDLLWEKV